MSRWIAMPIFSSSSLLLAVTAIWTVCGGMAVATTFTAFFTSASVSFVCVWLSLASTPMSPAGTLVTGSGFLPRIVVRWLMHK